MTSQSSAPQTPIAQTAVALTPAQAEILDLVLNMIVPPSRERQLPGAAEINFPEFLQTRVADLLPEVRGELDALEAQARKQYACGFATLDAKQRQSLVDGERSRAPSFMSRLALETVTCYYEHPAVLARIGIEDRPPYPKGYQVIAGDLMLLQPVRQRGKIYRDA